jgi:pSer/pThr/pTyr-binding forkhead associated (FHA) protein
MPEIIVKYEDRVIERIVTEKKRISIGRTADNDIVLDNLGVSRRHAQMEFNPDSAVIIDNESLNGTFVNSRKVTEEILKDDDQITIGKFNLIYHKNAERSSKLTDMDGTMVLRTKKQKELLERDQKARELVEKSGCSVLLGLDNVSNKKFYLDRDLITLGKSRFVDIGVKGFFLSRIQAKIVRENDNFFLLNLGRKNKTKINGESIRRERLKNDDLVQIGRSVFRFVEGNK